MYPLLYILYSLIFNLSSYCLCWWLGLRFWRINEVTVDQCCSWLGSSSLKAYWVGKVFAYFSNYLIDVWYHLKVVVSEFTVGITYTVMGKNYLKSISKWLSLYFSLKTQCMYALWDAINTLNKENANIIFFSVFFFF